MPRPRETTGYTLEQMYLAEVQHARRLEEDVHNERGRARERYKRASPNSDQDALNKMVADDPRVKALISLQHFALDKSVMYGVGMLGDKMAHVISLLEREIKR